LFYQDDDGDEVDIDVVPGREMKKDDFLSSRSLNIYFNENLWGYEEGTHQKTNIHSQINHIKGKSEAREIIRLLKIWKTTNKEEYKSFMFELFTVKAFDNLDVTGNLWDKMKSVMTYIEDNIVKDGFTLIDPGNSNNDVLESMEEREKQQLS